MKCKAHEREPHEWIICEPKCVDDMMEQFNAGCEALDLGESDEAEKTFRGILKKCPIHIDALHHLSIVVNGRGQEIEAYLLDKEAVSIGLDALGTKFDFRKDKLLWGFLDNRPFLRAYHGLALHLLKRKERDQGREILERLVATNPNDNLGARLILPEVYFETKDPESVVSLAARYPDDVSPELRYGAVLALVKMNRIPEATRLAEQTIPNARHIALELVKDQHRRPLHSSPWGIALGSPEEAWEYWSRYGKFWANTAEALALVRGLIEPASARTR
jgi:tetratricopeptide (TPR) repeat protein